MFLKIPGSLAGLAVFLAAASALPAQEMSPDELFQDGINNLAVDGLQYTRGPLHFNHNPRNGSPYFNTALFALPPLGSVGNSGRHIFSGPGIDNYDVTLQKNTMLTESTSCEFRVDAFNVFNHAQFYGPSSVDGNISSPTFGQVVSAAPPRVLQVAVKVLF